MQSKRGRIAVALVAVAAVVIAFLVLRPRGDEEETATQPVQEAASNEGEQQGQGEERGPSGEGAGAEIFQIDAGSGDVMDIEVSKGDEVRLVVRADAPDEIHVHGYDEYADVAPGEAAEIEFTANLEGIYEVELHDAATQIATLEVRP